jgi:hypothetical protein
MKSMPYLALMFALVFVMACAEKSPGRKILARINNYEISQEEFEEEFRQSIFGSQNTPQGRREFLNHLINQKLILQDAQGKGLDKKRGFLAAIENYWEQTLLRVALEQKAKELAGSYPVPEQEVRALYNRRMEAGVINTSFEQASPLLRREITKSKETQALSAWLEGLRKKADIKINEDLIK